MSIKSALTICANINRSCSIGIANVEFAAIVQSAVFATYQAALCCLELRKDIDYNRVWHGYIENILQILKQFSQRWEIAGK
jgi:hypothetical protein